MADFLAYIGSSIECDSFVNELLHNDDQIEIRKAANPKSNISLCVAFKKDSYPRDGQWLDTANLTAAYVGQLHNRRALAQQLGLAANASVLDVLIEGWSTQGADFFSRCHGSLAIVIADKIHQQMICARDKIGLITIQYASLARGKVIASNAQWIQWLLPPTKAVNRATMHDFLLGDSNDGTDDFIANVHRLRPGEIWHCDQRLSVHQQSYWNPRYQYRNDISADEASKQITQLIDAALIANNISRPRVISLSGGIDSNFLAALLNRHNGAIPTITTSMVAPGYHAADETEQIIQIEQFLGIHNQGNNVHGSCSNHFSIVNQWPLKSLEHYQKTPILGPHFHPETQYMMAYCRWLTQQHADFDLIHGLGADQLLGCTPDHYYRYIVKHAKWREFAPILKSNNPAFWQYVAKQTGIAAAELFHMKQPLKYIASHLGRNSIRQHEAPWRHPENWVSPCTPHHPFGHNPGASHTHRLKDYLSAWTWELTCRNIERYCRTTGIRMVFPYLDDQLWEFAIQLPPHILMHHGTYKSLLRKAASPYLPPQITAREKFASFDPIVEKGLAQKEASRINQLLENASLAQNDFINIHRLLHIYEQYRRASSTEQYEVLGSMLLWRTLAAELWLTNLSAD